MGRAKEQRLCRLVGATQGGDERSGSSRPRSMRKREQAVYRQERSEPQSRSAAARRWRPPRCPGRPPAPCLTALPRYALLRAAAARSRWALVPPLLTLAAAVVAGEERRGTRAVLRGCMPEVTALQCLLHCFSSTIDRRFSLHYGSRLGSLVDFHPKERSVS